MLITELSIGSDRAWRRVSLHVVGRVQRREVLQLILASYKDRLPQVVQLVPLLQYLRNEQHVLCFACPSGELRSRLAVRTPPEALSAAFAWLASVHRSRKPFNPRDQYWPDPI